MECASCGFRFTNPRPSSDEIGRYYESEEYTPHQDTSRGLIDTLYRWVRLYTLRSKRRLVASLVDSPPGRLLDFGCGTGEFLAHCRSHGWAACGLEPDEKAQEVAAATHGLTVEPPEHIHDLPSDHFDVITLWHVLEHVPKLSDTIAELRRTLAPTGTLIVAVPNCASLDAHYYGADWAAYDVPRHLYHFRPPDVHRLFDHFGMTVTDIRPMRLDAFMCRCSANRLGTAGSSARPRWPRSLSSGTPHTDTGPPRSCTSSETIRPAEAVSPVHLHCTPRLSIP